MKKLIYQRWLRYLFTFLFFPIAIYGIIMGLTEVTIKELVCVGILGILTYVIFLCLHVLVSKEKEPSSSFSDEELEDVSYTELSTLCDIFSELGCMENAKNIQADIQRKLQNENAVYKSKDE